MSQPGLERSHFHPESSACVFPIAVTVGPFPILESPAPIWLMVSLRLRPESLRLEHDAGREDQGPLPPLIGRKHLLPSQVSQTTLAIFIFLSSSSSFFLRGRVSCILGWPSICSSVLLPQLPSCSDYKYVQRYVPFLPPSPPSSPSLPLFLFSCLSLPLFLTSSLSLLMPLKPRTFFYFFFREDSDLQQNCMDSFQNPFCINIGRAPQHERTPTWVLQLVNEPVLTCPYHAKSMVSITPSSQHTFCGFEECTIILPYGFTL